MRRGGAILQASLEFNNVVLVCRGGNPGAAMPLIEKIKSSVLRIVGEKDTNGIEVNKLACSKLRSIKALKVVNGASHYFFGLGNWEKLRCLQPNGTSCTW
jgi:ribosomal protein L14E/L6E/L27E